MIEYAITNGEGTLLDYGVSNTFPEQWVGTADLGYTILMRKALDGCQTGE